MKEERSGVGEEEKERVGCFYSDKIKRVHGAARTLDKREKRKKGGEDEEREREREKGKRRRARDLVGKRVKSRKIWEDARNRDREAASCRA